MCVYVCICISNNHSIRKIYITKEKNILIGIIFTSREFYVEVLTFIQIIECNKASSIGYQKSQQK